MNASDRILTKLMIEIEKKQRWGKTELIKLIGQLALEEVMENPSSPPQLSFPPGVR